MAGGYEVLGNFLLDQAAQARADRKQTEAEARQERLLNEQRAYARGEKLDERAYNRTTKLEDEKRAYADGLIAAGLLSPAQRDDATAVAAAWAKTTPEYKVEFQEKLALRDELRKHVTEGIISDVQIFSNDIDTLRNIVGAARDKAGTINATSRDQEQRLRESQIAKNEAQAKQRIGGEQRAQNSAWWTAEVNNALTEFENATLSPAEIQQAQALAAQAPGAETSPSLYQTALQKAAATLLQTKQQAARLRAQNAQQAARVGAAIPGEQPAAAVAPGASVAPPDPNAGIQSFLQNKSGGAVTPAAAGPPPLAMSAPDFAPNLVVGASMLPLERLAALAPLNRRLAPLAGSSVGNPYAGMT